MLTRLTAMITSLYTQILNHYAVPLKQMSVIPQFTFVKKIIKKKTKLWYIQVMEYYSALKRNELPSHEKTWRNAH